MEKERKRELREAYKQRHPDMGVVCLRRGGEVWAAVTRDAGKDRNSLFFQLDLGSWPNRALQELYTADPESFVWELAKTLDYEDPEEDHSEELELLMLEFLDKYPDAKPLKRGGKLR